MDWHNAGGIGKNEVFQQGILAHYYSIHSLTSIHSYKFSFKKANEENK